MGIGGVIRRGVRVAVKTGRQAVPKARTAASGIASAHPTKTALKGVGLGSAVAAVGGGAAAAGVGIGFGVDAIRKGFTNPASQAFPDTLATGISPEEAAEDRKAREDLEPTPGEFFTSPTFLIIVALTIVAVVVLRGR